MNKAKLIFSQTLMISTAILFGLGIQALISYLTSGNDHAELTWSWYIPLSIVFTGFLCSLPTMLVVDDEGINNNALKLRITIHFFCVLGIVSLCGWLFKWYDSVAEYTPILIMHVLIYGFVWAACLWMAKTDEKKINEAIKEIQDTE